MNAIATTEKNTALVAPDFMREHGHAGTEGMGKFVQPPRIKCVQPLAKPPVSDNFSEGETCLMPQMGRIAGYDKKIKNEDQPPIFSFVPILYYVEYCAWNPLELKGVENAILERTYDERSLLAMKARNPDKRSEPKLGQDGQQMKTKDGKPLFVKNVEHLNFVVLIDPPHEFEMIPVILTYSRAEHRAGSRLMTLAIQRKAPLYGCRFQATVRKRENLQGFWYGIDCDNPQAPLNPWVDQADYPKYLAAHGEFKRIFDEKRLQTGYEDVEEPSADF